MGKTPSAVNIGKFNKRDTSPDAEFFRTATMMVVAMRTAIAKTKNASRSALTCLEDCDEGAGAENQN